MPGGDQNAIELAFQSLHPRTQTRRASDTKAYEQMDVIGHEDVSTDADVKVGCATTVFDEGLVHFGRGEQARASMSVERDEVDRRVGPLKN